MTKPLSGLLVVSVEQAVAAPTCTVKLADAGARVIKVEREQGEIARGYDKVVNGTSAYFSWLNRGKESAVLNLKSTDELDVLKAMIAQADVLVQNLAPGAMGRLGLDSKILVEKYPTLIVVDIVGYDSSTDYRSMRAYDMLVQAEAGICAVTGSADEPAKVGVSVADIATGMYAHAMVLEALIERGISGKGQHIEVAMFDAMADWMSVPFLYQKYGGVETKREGLAHAAIYPYTDVRCADGSLVLAVQNQAEWERFCEGVLERPDLIADTLFHDNPSRSDNRQLLDVEMAKAFDYLTQEQAIERLSRFKIAWSKFSTVPDLLVHPALRTTTVGLPNGGSFEIPVPAGRRGLSYSEVPALGRDTEKIRSEFSR